MRLLRWVEDKLAALLTMDIAPLESPHTEARKANTRLLRRKGLGRYRAARNVGQGRRA